MMRSTMAVTPGEPHADLQAPARFDGPRAGPPLAPWCSVSTIVYGRHWGLPRVLPGVLNRLAHRDCGPPFRLSPGGGSLSRAGIRPQRRSDRLRSVPDESRRDRRVELL